MPKSARDDATSTLRLLGMLIVVAIIGFHIGRGVERSASPQPDETGAGTSSPSVEFRSGGEPRGAGAFPEFSSDVDGYLRIPTTVRRMNAHLLKPYSRIQKGLRVRYAGNRFSANQPDLIWVPEFADGRYKLRWETLGTKVDGAGLVGIFNGNVLKILDDTLYDFGVGTLFVHVENETSGKSGYTLYETIIGDCDPADESLWVADDVAALLDRATVHHDGLILYRISQPKDQQLLTRWVKILADPERYPGELNGGVKDGGVHPVFAANVAYAVLMEVAGGDRPAAWNSAALNAVETFFEQWVEPNATAIRGTAVSWGYQFPWTTNWGIRLEPPWYSAYANARMGLNGALLFRLTGKDRYATLARNAVEFIGLPVEHGGAQYDILGFKLPAEYVYPSPPIPNVRVLDGELIVAAALFDIARLLGDSALLRLFMTQVGSLSMQLESYLRPDGSLEFSMYIEEMPQHYRWDIWSALQVLANESKDRRFSIVAREYAKHIPQEWKDANGS